MPMRRTRAPRRPRRRMPGRRRFGLKRMIRYNKVPSFTETINFGRLPTQSGQVFTLQFAALSQSGNYSNLYRQYRINRLTWMLVPDWNSFDPNAGAAAVNKPRVVYAIDDTANVVAPVNELDVLEDNGCKIRALSNIVKISHVPVPFLGQAVSIGGFASVNKKYQWLNTDPSGVLVPHGGVRLYVSNGGPPIIYTVYCKVSFSLKDPQ